MDGVGAVRAVDDHVAVIPKRRVPGLLPLDPGREPAEPVLIDDEDQVADVHVRDHALRLDRDHGRPGTGKEVQGKGDTAHDHDDPEKVAGEGDNPVIALPERRKDRCYTLQQGDIRHLL
ncbi:hypothetical protein DSECCO2_569130 [anaerobic digester metagenome]